MLIEENVPNERLRRARYLKGWTQSDLAEAVSTDFETVSRWERGTTMPSAYFREHLCRVLEQTPEELGFVQAPQLHCDSRHQDERDRSVRRLAKPVELFLRRFRNRVRLPVSPKREQHFRSVEVQQSYPIGIAFFGKQNLRISKCVQRVSELAVLRQSHAEERSRLRLLIPHALKTE